MSDEAKRLVLAAAPVALLWWLAFTIGIDWGKVIGRTLLGAA